MYKKLFFIKRLKSKINFQGTPKIKKIASWDLGPSNKELQFSKGKPLLGASHVPCWIGPI